jgi:hypothetical protein
VALKRGFDSQRNFSKRQSSDDCYALWVDCSVGHLLAKGSKGVSIRDFLRKYLQPTVQRDLPGKRNGF